MLEDSDSNNGVVPCRPNWCFMAKVLFSDGFNFASEENANFLSPSPEKLLISFGNLKVLAATKDKSSHLFKSSAYFMWFDIRMVF